MIYKDYSLSNPQLKILKELREYPLSDLKQFKKSDIDFLIKIEFISLNKEKPFFKNPNEAPFFYLRDTGRMFLTFSSRQFKLFLIPTIISILALIKSYSQEISVLLELISNLLKQK